MEILIVVMLMTVVVKRGVEDVWHTARGNTPPRYAAASARKKSGAAGQYWSQLWDDVWTDASAKRAARRAGSSPSSVSRPRGAATQFFAGLAQDGRRAAGRSWEKGWVRLDEKRRERATRPRPETVTVPGTVVPNVEDGDDYQDGPDGDLDGDEDFEDVERQPSRFAGDGDGRTDLRFGDDPTDPTGVSSCPECKGTGVTEDGVCLSCRDRQEQRNQHWDGQSVPDSAIDQDISPTAPPTTTEGPTMTTMPTGEVAGLSDMINFCDGSVAAFKAQIHATELSIAAAAAGGVTGPGAAKLAHAMELCTAAAAAYDEAAVEYKSHVVVQEAYDAVPGAGTREFVTAGR